MLPATFFSALLDKMIYKFSRSLGSTSMFALLALFKSSFFRVSLSVFSVLIAKISAVMISSFSICAAV
nr:MAG TPA: hypothetical protein [Caudoviricetes sp.]